MDMLFAYGCRERLFILEYIERIKKHRFRGLMMYKVLIRYIDK